MLTKKAVVLAAGLGLFAAASLPGLAYADSCDATATDKKLAGAAKTSFTKKCVADATGA